jgi:hypothetical protein
MQHELFEFRIDSDDDDQERDDRTRLSKVGEFLAAAELTAQGFDVTVAGEKLPYDLIADRNGRLVKVQVKAASYSPEWGYRFCTHRCSHKGAGRSRAYTAGDVDLFAFVAVDIRALVFMPAANVIDASYMELSRASFQQAGLAGQSLRQSLGCLGLAA